MSQINPSDRLLARLLRGASTADLYDVVAAGLSEMKDREDASGEPEGLDLNEVRVEAEFGEIRYDAYEGRFMAAFYDEGSAMDAAEQRSAGGA